MTPPSPDLSLTRTRKAQVAIITEHITRDLRVRALLRDPAHAQHVIFETVADCLFGSRAMPQESSQQS